MLLDWNKLYRLHEGHIEMQVEGGAWRVSAHDTALAEEIPQYEEMSHVVAPLLKQKYGVV